MTGPKAFQVKLLIDRSSDRVLFAEAEQEFVDFLFSLLALPLGSIIKLIGPESTSGCFYNLYDSISKLKDSYMYNPSVDKPRLLSPTLVPSASPCLPLLSLPPPVSNTLAIYPQCNEFTYETCYLTGDMNNHKEETAPTGYVKSSVPFMVMDDLSVIPISTISMVTILNKFNLTNLGALEEKLVHFGSDQALKLLKLSMETKSILSSLFLSMDATTSATITTTTNLMALELEPPLCDEFL